MSVSMQPLAVHRESFESPGLVCEAVPGWRDALVLHDPEGLAASLIAEAREWTWDPLENRCNAWVAEEVVSRAETVQKLVSALKKGRRAPAAVKRSLITAHLARALAVHHRILYGSENRLWDLVSDAMGEEWRRTQNAALGRGDEPLEETCRSALRLYGLAAGAVERLLDGRQKRVVRHALSLTP